MRAEQRLDVGDPERFGGLLHGAEQLAAFARYDRIARRGSSAIRGSDS